MATSRANWKNWSTFIQTPGPTANLPTYLCTRLQCWFSLSLSISLSMPSLPLCLSQPFYIVFVFLISNLTAISFRYLLFLLRMTQLSQQKLSAQNEHLCQFKFLFGKAVAALPRNRHRLKEILFSLGKSMKKDRRRRRRRRRYKNERNLVKVSRWSAANKRATFSSSSLLSFLKRFFWWKFASSTNFERRCSWSLHRRKLFYIFKNLVSHIRRLSLRLKGCILNIVFWYEKTGLF